MSVSFAAKPARLPHDGDITGGISSGYKPLLRYLHTSGLERLKRWVLSFGSRAEVLSPPSLREEVAAELARAAGRYGRGERGDDGPETVYG
jgi:predicted DNA-binding transcriptional regulator YafY